ncbi:MAG: hypothetical protein KBG15_11485 [Kofleriaceae bacterium]|nr:hypothetical protein [Kofleriaceae bacterium]
MKRYLWIVCAAVMLAGPAVASVPAFADQALAPTAKATGVLDLTLLDQGNGIYRLQNSKYQVTFPAKPDVSAQDSTTKDITIKGALAIQTTDRAGNLGNGFMMVPIPAGVPYDAKAGLKAARGSILQTVKGKVVKESPANLGGVPGTKTVAHGIVDGTKLEVSTWFAFDVKNHTVLGLFTLRELGAASDDVQVFVDSFKVLGAGAALVGANDDGIERTGFHNVEIAPAGNGTYVLNGDGYSIVYPSKPAFSTFDVPWPTGPNKAGTAMAEQGEGAHGIVVTYVPDGVTYDAKLGLDGARDKMLEGMKAKLVSEKPTTVSGFKGRVVYGSMIIQGKQATVRAHLAYLPKRRAVFGVLSLWVAGDRVGEKNANTFLKSLKITK